MNIEENFILSILRRLVAGTENESTRHLTNDPALNWNKIEALLFEHGIAPLVYPVLNSLDAPIPQKIKESLKSCYYFILLQNLISDREFIRIKSVFVRSNVSLVPIKGTAFLQDVYARSFVRPMVDMDFLVKEGDFLRAQDALKESGYKKDLEGLQESYWRNHQCHIVFRKNAPQEAKNMHIDLHWALDFKRKGTTILPRMWERVREIKTDSHTITLLSPEDNLFSLALHQRRFGKIINLKYALDVALILRKYDDFDWDYIIRESHKGKMCSCVFFILSQTKYFLGIDVPAGIWRALGVSPFKQKIIQSFIAKNAFKSSSRKNLKKIYLGSHFLLYDNFREPLEYVINIPIEQFAKFYGISPYTKRTRFYYNNRLWYMPFKFIKEGVND